MEVFINQIVNDSDHNAIEEGKLYGMEPYLSGFQQPSRLQQTETDSKIKSIKPRAKLMMKSIDNKLSTAKLKNHKETFLKEKLNKGFTNKDVESSHGNKSNETFANTDDDKHEFEYSNSLYQDNENVESNINQFGQKVNLKSNESFGKPKMSSKLSLKSKAYMCSKVPNFKYDTEVLPNQYSNRYNQTYQNKKMIDSNQQMNFAKDVSSYHRHSLPHKPLEVVSSI